MLGGRRQVVVLIRCQIGPIKIVRFQQKLKGDENVSNENNSVGERSEM